jgi:hypothetical protein
MHMMLHVCKCTIQVHGWYDIRHHKTILHQTPHQTPLSIIKSSHDIPTGKRLHKYGKSQFFHGKTGYKWPCSIAMLNYQRVSHIFQ